MQCLISRSSVAVAAAVRVKGPRTCGNIVNAGRVGIKSIGTDCRVVVPGLVRVCVDIASQGLIANRGVVASGGVLLQRGVANGTVVVAGVPEQRARADGRVLAPLSGAP